VDYNSVGSCTSFLIRVEKWKIKKLMVNKRTIYLTFPLLKPILRYVMVGISCVWYQLASTLVETVQARFISGQGHKSLPLLILDTYPFFRHFFLK